MLMGQQAKTWPDFTRSKSKTRRPRLPFSASMMTQVSKRNVAMSTAGYFFEALVVFLAQLLDPLGRSLLEFGMVLVFTRPKSAMATTQADVSTLTVCGARLFVPRSEEHTSELQ